VHGSGRAKAIKNAVMAIKHAGKLGINAEIEKRLAGGKAAAVGTAESS